jgi:SAM-dependent methyltransferase
LIPATTFEWLTWKVGKNLRSRGLRGTFRVCLLKIADAIKSLRAGDRRLRREERAFDRKHNVHTGYFVRVYDLDSLEQCPFGNNYQPTPPLQLGEILAGLRVNLSDFVFVDLGCGMGRALFIAAEFPFSKVVGVEYSAELSGFASKNVQTLRRDSCKCQNIEVVTIDASRYVLPDQATVLYFFNPFQKEILRCVMDNVERSLAEHPRPILIVYLFPEHASILEEAPLWEKIAGANARPGRVAFAIYRNRTVTEISSMSSPR